MEIGDIFIINKSDRDDAAKVKAEVEYVLHLKMSAEDTATNPIVMTSALEESGLDELQETIQTYYQALKSDGRLEEKRKRRIAREMKLILLAKVRDHVNRQMNLDRHIIEWVDAAYQKQVKPYAFINEKLNAFFAGGV
jgi:LAO/AO transport system kinase